ncbi:MAG: tRNA preQ1(34) S-adenosylmethionine ribosyltransferase-isomerase QueA [Acidobacteriota bacterium]|nr:tRNA preQ1(34) S-adenosylmethionine ribosyltransferase-isomerase QueA [Acidobacteriota bacterium]
MRVGDFDYHLPVGQIAQQAATPRHAARMLVLERGADCPPRHRKVADLPGELSAGDLLVVNNTRVVPARLLARKPSGGRVEVFLLEALDAGRRHWRALLGASRRPVEGSRVRVAEDFEVEIVSYLDGVVEVRLVGDAAPDALIDRHGRPPLPPYIRRAPDDPRLEDDRRRYQTVFARRAGAVAAPTAGLHFSGELLADLRRRGVEVAEITLHVGEGTFRPLEVDRLDQIQLHAERYEVPAETSRAIAAARRRGGRVVAVGTTVVRALESRAPVGEGVPGPGGAQTRLFIAPGFAFRYVDALLTNFHLPRSSLLMLVAAFAGRERVLTAYRLAVDAGYRFYSYGDAMLVL